MSEYNPPYESPIEEVFAWNLNKYINESCSIEKQFEITTHENTFRVDFRLSINDSQIILECDGKEYHTDTLQDEMRDALLLGSGQTDAVYRIPGSKIMNAIDESMYTLCCCEPAFFSPRSKDVLKRKNQDKELIKLPTDPNWWKCSLGEIPNPSFITAKYKNNNIRKRQYWPNLYEQLKIIKQGGHGPLA